MVENLGKFFLLKFHYFQFVLTLFSSFLQLYVMFAALKHIKRKTSDKCLHVFLLSMTMADFLLTGMGREERVFLIKY